MRVTRYDGATVTRRARALAQALECAAAATASSHGLRGVVVHHEALSGLAGPFITYSEASADVCEARRLVRVLPDQPGTFADLYREIVASLRLRAHSMSRAATRSVLELELEGAIERLGLLAMLQVSWPRVSAPPAATACEDPYVASMEVTWSGATGILDRPEGRLAVELDPVEVDHRWPSWVAMVPKAPERHRRSDGGERDGSRVIP